MSAAPTNRARFFISTYRNALFHETIEFLLSCFGIHVIASLGIRNRCPIHHVIAFFQGTRKGQGQNSCLRVRRCKADLIPRLRCRSPVRNFSVLPHSILDLGFPGGVSRWIISNNISGVPQYMVLYPVSGTFPSK